MIIATSPSEAVLSETMDHRSGGEANTQHVRTRILDAASRLIARGGVAALTTRAVAAAASVQPPTLYRLFGDKRGLLDAVAEHGLADFIAGKTAAVPHPDPLQELHDAWDAYVGFGLDNPAVFAIMNDIGSAAATSPAALAGIAVLRSRVRRLALAGRLRVTEARAVALIHAAGVGTVATLLALPEGERDPGLSPAAREAVFAALTTEGRGQTDGALASLAVSLRARLDTVDILTAGERLLLAELMDKLADQHP